jgi:hypothetical protein
MPTPASEMATVTMTRLSGSETRFSIAKLIQEIRSPPASIVEDRNDNNTSTPFRRLEQRRDVMVRDARDGYCGQRYGRLQLSLSTMGRTTLWNISVGTMSQVKYSIQIIYQNNQISPAGRDVW